MKRIRQLFFFCLSLFTCHLSLPVVGQTQYFYTSDNLSSNQITQICRDQVGYIWVGTEFGLNKYDGYRFTNYFHETDNAATISSNVISFLFVDSRGNLWVGTQKGLDRYDDTNDQFLHVPLQGAKGVPRINHILQEDEHHLLIGTAGYGLFRLDIRDDSSQKLEGYAKGDTNYFSYIFIDEEGAFWKSGHGSSISRRDANGRIEDFESPYGTVTGFVGYEGGVLMVCIHGMLFYRDGVMYSDFFDQGALGGSELLLRTAIRDRHGNLFIGTMGNGLCWIPKGEHTLKKYEYASATFDLGSSNVWALYEDHQDNLWVGCQKRGLLLLPQQQPLFRTWKFADLHVSTGGSLTSVCLGENGIIWCAVQNNGILGLDASGRIVAHPASPEGTYLLYRDRQGGYWIGTNGGVYAYDPMTGRSQRKVVFSNGHINAMTDDGHGHLFFSVFSEGFCSYNVKTGELRRFNMHQNDSIRGRLHNDWISQLFFDSKGKLWICTASGVNCYDPVEDHFRPYGWEVVLDYNAVETVYETSEHKILIGTNTGLYLYDNRKGDVVPFPGAEVLANKVVCGIVEDQSGDLWCSTAMGIWQYQTQKGLFVNYLHGNGLGSREYVNGVAMHTSDDRIWFGISDGITSFTPKDIRDSRPAASTIHLTGVYIGSNTVRMPQGDTFEFSYLDNTFTLEFSLLNYLNTENVVYEYRINKSEAWTTTMAGRNRIPFTHLQPGSYILEVRAFDSGTYTETQEYRIIIHAPWYRSSWAYLIYILVGLVVLGLLVWFDVRRRQQELDEEKMKFLINATHDIRSPLTLIMSPLQKLKIENEKLKKSQNAANLQSSIFNIQSAIETIEHNAQRVQNLVNQILDIRKIDKQQMHLHCQETDMVQYVGNLLKSYEYTARERGMNFKYVPATDKLNVWFDRKAIDKVVDNLLTNAFKYTYDNGEIEVRVADNGHGMAEMQVIDNGMGIRGDLHKIFDRFYQGSSSRSVHIEGTGIGLNLCKMMVEMHHGTIEAANREAGQGSIFTVRLPLGTSHLTKEEMLLQQEGDVRVAKPKAQSNYHVLVVDDDEEIGHYIHQELGVFYHITPVTSAREALRRLLGAEADKQFDLVISDVMMPEMDGFTLLRMIKTNMNLSHIPVVILTSKADVANRLEGLEKGADAYLAKPFDMDELHVVINNLINKTLRLRGKYSGNQQQKHRVVETKVKGNDEALMERIMKVVNEHLSDSNFNVETMTMEVGISRAQLHRKMKEMTGLSVSEFVRNIRLEQAVRLLKEQKINVTQVAYTVGFSNLAHFSTVFRKQFGVSPSEYTGQNLKDDTN